MVLDGRLPSNTRWGTSAVRRAFGLHLLRRLAEGQGLGLGEDIRDEDVVMPAQRIEGVHEADEVAGDEPRALVDELVERVLAVGARLAPVDRARVVVDPRAVEGDVLAVRLHGQLLEVGGEALQVLLVGQHGHRLRAEEVVVPDGEETHEHGQVALEGRGAEVLVHLVEAVEHGAEVVRPHREHGGEADGRVHGVAPAHPVPEAEHVRGVDAELRHLGGVGGDGHEVLGDGLVVAAQAREAPLARAARVGHGLQRGEGLGGDDEERLRGIEIAHGLREVGAVDVGDEAKGHGRARCRSGAPRRPSPGPRSEPPMPMLITLRMRFPVCPFQAPLRTRWANSLILSRTSCTSGTTSTAVHLDRGGRGARAGPRGARRGSPSR